MLFLPFDIEGDRLRILYENQNDFICVANK